MEVGNEGGLEAGFGGEVFGDAAGEAVVAAEAEGAATTRELVEAVEVEGMERMGGGDGLGGSDGAAGAGAAGGVFYLFIYLFILGVVHSLTDTRT